jgi:hypothetical protein
VDLVVLAPKQRAARCRLLGTAHEITLRSRGVWDMVPGEILTVRVRKQWRYAGHPYVSGEVEGRRLDVPALGLVPLRLLDEAPWDPSEEFWGEAGEPLEAWERRIVDRGRRPSFEMEQILPGADPEDFDNNPILEASDLAEAGDPEGAREMLGGLLAADLRCLDSHAHLGLLALKLSPTKAIRHYETGVLIGELSLGDGFDGLLPWARIDNRPFLRCLHGFGLCLWRLDRDAGAASVFERMLWLNPADNQGARILLAQVRAGRRWEDDREGGLR